MSNTKQLLYICHPLYGFLANESWQQSLRTTQYSLHTLSFRDRNVCVCLHTLSFRDRMSAYITNFYEQHQTIIIYLPSTLWLSCKRKLTTVAEDRPVQLTHFEFSRSNCNGLRLNFAKCSKVKWECSSLRMRLSAFSGDVRTKSMLWLYHCVVGLEGNLKDTVF